MQMQDDINDGLAARAAAREVLSDVLRKRVALEAALSDSNKFKALFGPDRSFARALVSTTLRRLGQLDEVIDAYLNAPLGKKGRSAQDILRLGAAQLLVLETPPHAVVSTAVEMAAQRKDAVPYKGLINAVLRKIADKGPGVLADHPARLNVPGWLWRSWDRAYGPKTAQKIAEAHYNEAALDLTAKDDPAPLAEGLEASLLPTGSLRRETTTRIADLPGFEDGAWWIQDAAAALPAKLFGDLSGKTVIDLCAAPGGKTLQLAAAGANVTAVERSEGRAKRLKENLSRMSLQANVVINDAIRWRPKAEADAVLLDAPCTATGTIRRHPDLPWIKEEKQVADLVEIQTKLLNAAAEMVKPGGTLVYCVCSLQREESEAQTAAFVKAHDAFERRPITAEELGVPTAAISKAGDLRTLPFMMADLGGIDGFYAARLQRKA